MSEVGYLCCVLESDLEYGIFGLAVLLLCM